MKRKAEVNRSRPRLVTSYAERFLVRNAGQQTPCDAADKCIAWLVLGMDTFAKLFGSLLALVYGCFLSSAVVEGGQHLEPDATFQRPSARCSTVASSTYHPLTFCDSRDTNDRRFRLRIRR